MGRGKSTAAIQYMDENKDKQRFLYITPYLSEVERICQWCDFDEPKDDSVEDDASAAQGKPQIPKSVILKEYLREGKNISTTHSLFYIMDEEARELVGEALLPDHRRGDQHHRKSTDYLSRSADAFETAGSGRRGRPGKLDR